MKKTFDSTRLCLIFGISIPDDPIIYIDYKPTGIFISPNKGKPCPEETKILLSEANKGKKRSDVTKERIRQAKLGVPRSAEAKQKMSEGRKGKKFGSSEKRNASISKALKGRKCEWAAKISAAKKAANAAKRLTNAVEQNA